MTCYYIVIEAPLRATEYDCYINFMISDNLQDFMLLCF